MCKADNTDSGTHDACFFVSLAADDLPTFKSVPPQQVASWKHLLQANLLDTIFEATARHLAELGFDDAGTDPNTPPPLSATHMLRKEPDSITFPFFVSGCDEHSGKCSACDGAQTHLSFNSSYLSVSGACATALEILWRLAGIATGDGEVPLLATQPPAVVAMTFVGKHVGIWVVNRIEHSDLHVSESRDTAEVMASANYTGSKQRAGICIWNGDMTRLRDIVELTVIFKKIAAWSTTTFRNWISTRVAGWASRFPQLSAEGEDDEQLEALEVQIGKLRISRTNSFGVNKSSKTPTKGDHER
ncbi:hypothetical protein B0H63DRAFT_121135 [Podospora didyma]|uniref:Uncharacterized protein n=1 Tax=Podospora didyma TaxID=330526 RepID=A0AAE0U4H0_9PEZI|nr:hypothetical protein B0H63DRAFT_121135 [Podospora didyma]